jgi:hypothetical protein
MEKFFGKIATFIVVFLGFDVEEVQKINYNPDVSASEDTPQEQVCEVYRLVSADHKKITFRSNRSGRITVGKIVDREGNAFRVRRIKGNQVFRITGDQKVAV